MAGLPWRSLQAWVWEPAEPAHHTRTRPATSTGASPAGTVFRHLESIGCFSKSLFGNLKRAPFGKLFSPSPFYACGVPCPPACKGGDLGGRAFGPPLCGGTPPATPPDNNMPRRPCVDIAKGAWPNGFRQSLNHEGATLVVAPFPNIVRTTRRAPLVSALMSALRRPSVLPIHEGFSSRNFASLRGSTPLQHTSTIPKSRNYRLPSDIRAVTRRPAACLALAHFSIHTFLPVWRIMSWIVARG